ncbi:ABC transporter ATP-binding protein [Aceticella autotrophica]|uniref:ABC transporter ATP-binding protein n=1 Tax=Aceticella autotrophica TaxID=2755338 RepID=A0A975GA09_9THEO|nr:ABC transporter ATP-binding protein [Aceticella autotrophica]QSZ26786.1 ABC transporter ATP-binding protein [Aceticella autotrophica]
MTDIFILQVNNLTTCFKTRHGIIKAADNIFFKVKAGKTLGLVGESGCGKSITALSILKLIEPPGEIVSGEVWFEGCDLLKLPSNKLQKIRGKEIAMVFQDPLTSLNPVLTVGTQLVETLISHGNISLNDAKLQSASILLRMGLSDPEYLMRQYPFQLSGGMRQRVMMGMALLMSPKVLIADEPTTALDVTLQAQIISEMKRLQEEIGMAIILITHDLGVVAAMADEVAVMYAGSIVEYGLATEIFEHPVHPYTQALLCSVPRIGKKKLIPINGQPPKLLNLPSYCAFFPRCTKADKECRGEKPKLLEVESGHLAACHKIFLKAVY